MHPSLEQLQGFALGTLTEEAADQLVEHLRQCAECEATLTQLEHSRDTVLESLRRNASQGESSVPGESAASHWELEEACVQALER